jgi:exosortase
MTFTSGLAEQLHTKALGISRMRLVVVALTAVGLLLCYASTLRGMFDQWSNDEDMSHGFVVPIVILWIVWREREWWRALPAEPSWWGLPVLVVGDGMQFVAVLGAGLFASSVAFLISIIGAILSLGGFAWLRALALPLLLALFMLPKLALVYDPVTLPMQLLASRMAAGILSAVGIGVIREGSILDVAGRRVAVVEACNGIRYLLSLGFMAVVFAYLSDPKPWMRTALLVAAVPIAIVANALRVAAAGWAPSLAAGTPHAVSGWILFVLCLAGLVVMRQLFNRVYARYQS